MRTKSSELFAKALRLMPGGVNSPVRAVRAVGGDPVFIASGKGSRITDVDGNTYIDYVGSWGPLILGHALRKSAGRSRRNQDAGATAPAGLLRAIERRLGRIGRRPGCGGGAGRKRPREDTEIRRVLSRPR